MIRILIADDEQLVSSGVRAVLSIDPEIEVVGEAADGAEAAKLARELRADVVMMDVMMPGRRRPRGHSSHGVGPASPRRSSRRSSR